MPATHVQVPHEGRWYVAELLRQYRHEGRWRALVRYTVGPGYTYVHARWCDDLRPVAEDLHDPPATGDARTSLGSFRTHEGDGRHAGHLLPDRTRRAGVLLQRLTSGPRSQVLILEADDRGVTSGLRRLGRLPLITGTVLGITGLTVAVLATVGIIGLNTLAASAAEQRYLFAAVKASAYQHSALQEHALHEGQVDAEAEERADRDLQRVLAALDKLTADAQASKTITAFERYEEAVHQQLHLVEEGETRVAERLDEDATDPAFEEFLTRLDATNERLDDTARRASLLANLGTVVLVLMTTGLVAWLVQRERKARARAAAEQQHRATHDALTGLPNRVGFREHVESVLVRRGDADRGSVIMLYLDLDDFKVVNDTLGHWIGDQLLALVADRLRASVRSDDVVARMGGDEFTVLLRGGSTPKEASDVAERLITAMAEPFTVDDHVLQIGASVGIATGRPATSTFEELLRSTDVAMYEAKRRGKGQYQVFEPALDEQMRHRVAGAAKVRAV